MLKSGPEPDLYFKGNKRGPILAEEFDRNSAEHLQEEIAQIGLIINNFFKKSKDKLCEESQAYQGLFVSEAEVDFITMGAQMVTNILIFTGCPIIIFGNKGIPSF